MDIKNLPHRNELFFKKNNFKFINDSKSTNFDSVRYALKNNNNIFLILGGLLKKGDNFYIRDLKSNILKIYIFGENTSYLRKSLEKQNIPFQHFKKLKQVVNNFYMNEFTKHCDQKKFFTCLFSPGAASFDQFKNFEERGIKFKKYIYELFNK